MIRCSHPLTAVMTVGGRELCKTQSVPYLLDGERHASAFLVRVLLFASFYLNGKLITNCMSGWQLLTGKSFYKAHFSVPILFVLLGLLSVPLV